MHAWHFVNGKLRDGSPIPHDGEWLTYDGPLKMCNSGLHASLEPVDALQYAPGNTLCYVEVEGEMLKQDDKLVCRRRKIIKRMDAEEMLRYFARMQALSVIHLWDAADVVLDYLMSGDSKIRDAAWAAARDAARDAAWDAVWAAAGAAAGDAVRAAARDAAWAAARNNFNALVYESFGLNENGE